jgi:uncharacterized membrane protein YqaE (UPF0057 family)
MKKLNLFFVSATLGAILFNSCSVEKRYHRTGFNVNWNNTSVKIKKDKNHKNVTDEIASEELVVVDKKDINKSIESNTSSYSNSIESSVASTSDDISTVIINDNSKSELLSNSTNEENFSELNKSANDEIAEISTINRKDLRKAVLKANKKILKSNAASPEPWVYILLILLVPFGTTISMYLYEGSWTKRVTVNLILTLLCGLPGLIHALVVIFGKK